MKDGGVTRIAAVSEDTTDERVLLEALRESEQLFRLLAENSTDVIGRTSADGRDRVRLAGEPAVYGYEPEEMVGLLGSEFIHPDDLVAMTADFSRASPEPGVITNSYRVHRGDGGYVWIEAKIRALRDPDQRVVEFHTVGARRQRAQAGRGRGRAARARRPSARTARRASSCRA